MRKRTLHSAFVLTGFVTLSFLVALSGVQFQPGDWYAGLSKPSWTPPDAAFGPVWTVLYILMAVSAWLVWTSSGFSKARAALGVYAFQLGLNASWSWVFFGLQRTGLGLVNIVLLWLGIATAIALFFRHNRIAAFLMLPYLIWVAFAGILNFGIWRLNA